MIVCRALLGCLPGLLAVPLLAQPEIGGGVCSSSTLSGTYAASLTGRDVSSSVAFTNIEYAIGSAVFDGLSKVTLNLTTGTSKFPQTPQTLTGTYTMQSNCVGTVSITSGDSATYSLTAYNSGRAYAMVGQDGVYSITVNGGLLPATCPSAIPAQGYSFSGNGFLLSSAQIAGAFNISGLIQTGPPNTLTLNSQYSSAAGFKTLSASGTYTVSPGCVATASLLDASGNPYYLTFELTSNSGGNFTFISSSAGTLILASGRPL